MKHLGETGKCQIENTPKGWFITYVEEDPKMIMYKLQKEKREKHELTDEQRIQRTVAEQAERAAKVCLLSLSERITL